VVDHGRNLLDPEMAMPERPPAVRSGISRSCGHRDRAGDFDGARLPDVVTGGPAAESR